MKKLRYLGFMMLFLLMFSKATAQIDELTPKLEMRSAWVATVWRLDWPSTISTGSEATINAQKNELTRLLDSLTVNNFNAVNFQVRTMCDAFYKSSYEPWASWLTDTRGKDPGWDPLEFCVEECHKRNIECHAWVNPYRFNSSTAASGGLVGDATGYVENGWVINCGSGTILNPGISEVQDRIVAVCKEIISNYDIDGMLFDDYYYNGASTSEDETQYSAYTTAGGTLSQADWRRKNVTDLMRKLYTMINETKPWIRFGQAPQGATYTTQSLADKYGIDPCPAQYDNNYSSQYIDIMEWLDLGLIDFISPQVYWTIGHTNDYSKIVPWWCEIANHFGRHLFVSQSISSLTSSSDVSAPTSTDSQSTQTEDTESVYLKSSGPNNSKFSEYVDEIKLNRSSSKNGQAGMIFYSARYAYRLGTTPSFAHYLKRHVYSRPALMPAMTWRTQATDPGTVANLSYDGVSTLRWDTLTNMRYSVYAVPNGVSPEAFKKEVDYLVGMTYGTEYTIPEDMRSGRYFAVCAYDRYGNEWTPAVWKPNYSETLPDPVLKSPADGFVTDKDFAFTWEAVEGAEFYTVNFATDEEFSDMIKSVQSSSTRLLASKVYGSLPKNQIVYWRVHSNAANKNDGVSEVRSFTYQLIEITYPANNAEDLDPKMTFTWSNTSEGEVTLEVASDETFSNIVLTRTSTTGSYTTLMYELHPAQNYYARVMFNGNYSNYVAFKTKVMACEPPVMASPTDGGICFSDTPLAIEPQDGAEIVTILVSSTEDFSSNSGQKKTEDFAYSVMPSDIKINRRNSMADGTTYYVKAQATYLNEYGSYTTTDWGPSVKFTYKDENSGVGSISEINASMAIKGDVVSIKAGEATTIKVIAVNMLGIASEVYSGIGQDEEISLAGLPTGVYVIKANVGGSIFTEKMVKQ